MSRYNPDMIRYNESALKKTFSEKSLFEKITTVLCVVVIIWIFIGLRILFFMSEKPEGTDYTKDQSVTIYESSSNAVIEDSAYVQE